MRWRATEPLSSMATELSDELVAYGALPSQLIDVKRDDDSRVLSYLDLRAQSEDWRPPVVVESAGRPCVHVFDGRTGVTPEEIGRWCWRVTLRGDGAWVGVAEPGRLRVFRADVRRDEVRSVEVLSASRGEWALPKFLNDVSAGQDDVARRRYLTKLLYSSANDATQLGLSQTDALSLVGRGLLWRFLRDRNLLIGLQPSDVCEGAKTWEQCLDNKSRALRTFQWLDSTFNGGLLPFEGRLREFDAAVFSGVLGNISHGATETGQLRLPTDWHEVNFSYVPVGLLSEVYEAFAHTIDAADAAQRSIHYTPAHLVEFIVAQSLEQLPEGGRPRVLDPAAGAGVFLVTAFRKLVEREWQETGERPKRRRIREILNKQLVGFDTDPRALRLAELALYLTALELDPKPKPLSELKFSELRETVLFHLSDAGDGSLGPVDKRFKGAFDLVVGNPPWTAKARGGAAKKRWVEHTKSVAAVRLGEERAADFDFPDTNMELPFIWRAIEWTRDGGRIALVTHARWLFGLSPRARQARNDLLETTRVTGVLNGAALRLSRVWPEVNAPWCVVFATNELPQPFARAAFQFVSPALDEEVDSRQARVRIDWLDAQTVLAAEVIECPWSLKARFRGGRVAIGVLRRMQENSEKLGDYVRRRRTSFREGHDTFRNGYQVGGAVGKQLDASHLKGLPDTKGTDRLGFVVDVDALPEFERRTLLFPREREVYRAPLLLVTESVRRDRLTPRASRADKDVAFHESLHGLSLAGMDDADALARYLQLCLQSSAMAFAELLMDSRYGVERDAIQQETLELLPVVPLESLGSSQRRKLLALSKRLDLGLTDALLAQLDELIFETLALSNVERQTIRDTLDTMLPTRDAKRRAARKPSAIERERFIETLRSSLDNVLAASNQSAVVREHLQTTLAPWRLLDVSIVRSGVSAQAQPPLQAFLEEADTQGASLVIVRTGEATWFIGLLERYVHWTPTRARMLASDLVSELDKP